VEEEEEEEEEEGVVGLLCSVLVTKVERFVELIDKP
jgi:hypothetical protein